VTIPLEMRKILDLGPGTQISLRLEDGVILLQPITDGFIDSIPGSLGGPSLGALRDREHRDQF
jgi:hypothetical protein